MQLTHTDIAEFRKQLRYLCCEPDDYAREKAVYDYLDTLPKSWQPWARGVVSNLSGRNYARGLPGRHGEFSLATVTHEQWLEKFNRVLAALDTGAIIGLTGKRGSGKTQMAIEAVKVFKSAGWSASYDRLTDFYMEIKATFRRDAQDTESDVIKRWIAPKLLVLDECHEKADSSWVSTMLNHLVDKRYGNRSDTIMVANLGTGTGKLSFADAIGSSIADRMREGGGLIECNWESFRGAK